MHGGIPAAGHADEIALDRPHRAACTAVIIDVRDVDCRDPAPAVHAGDCSSKTDFERGFLRLHGSAAQRPAARVDDGGFNSARVEIERGVISAVVVREYHGTRAGPHRIAIRVRARSRGQHHAGPVVVGKHERALECAGGEDDLRGPHFPQALRRRMCRRLRGTFNNGERVMVEIAEHGAAAEHGHVRQSAQFRERAPDPVQRRVAIDVRALGEQAAAEVAAFVRDDDARAGACRGQRGGKPGRTAAGNEHIAVRMMVRVVGGVGLARRASHAGNPAYPFFINQPQRRRPHERLVIEASG